MKIFIFFLTEAEQMAGYFLDFGVQRTTLGSAVSSSLKTNPKFHCVDFIGFCNLQPADGHVTVSEMRGPKLCDKLLMRSSHPTEIVEILSNNCSAVQMSTFVCK